MYHLFGIGTCPIIISNDGDSDVDDGLYVIDHIDQYLESKNICKIKDLE